MLSQTLDEIMTKAKRFEHITRATKFSSVFKTTDEQDEQLMQKRISKYSAKVQSNVQEENWEVENLIVEDPDEVKFDIEFKHSEGERKPFFKAISLKLSKKLQYQA